MVGIGFDIASWELLGGFRPFFRRRFELGFFFFFGNLARSLGGRYWSWDFVWLILWFEFGDFIVARIVFVHLLMTE